MPIGLSRADVAQRFRAKWAPVRVKKTRQKKSLEHSVLFNQNRMF
jgi:hypothetical protein